MNPQQIAEQSVRQFLGDDTVAQSLGTRSATSLSARSPRT
jgi:hypothetical protein